MADEASDMTQDSPADSTSGTGQFINGNLGDPFGRRAHTVHP